MDRESDGERARTRAMMASHSKAAIRQQEEVQAVEEEEVDEEEQDEGDMWRHRCASRIFDKHGETN